MDVTLLIGSLAGGGAEGVCVNIANGLAEKGLRVSIIVLNTNKSVYHSQLHDEVKLIDLNVKNARYSFFKLWLWLKNNKPKCVITFTYELAIISKILQSFVSVKYKIIARNINTFSKVSTHSNSFFSGFLKYRIIKNFYKKVDLVVNQCQGMEDDLLRSIPELHKRTTVIYNPVNNNIEKYARNDILKNKTRENKILCVGRLEEQKGFNYAINAFSNLVKWNPGLKLVIIGEGSLKYELQNLVDTLNIADSVVFKGFVDNVEDYYSTSKLVLLTSLYEGFPNVLVESISMGTPIVAFNCPSGPKEIVTEANGYLVNFGDVESLEFTMGKALTEQWDKNKIHNDALIYSRENIIGEWVSIITG